MKESIIIKNLGPLKEVEIRYIKPQTVFIDKSVSCKSTIMKIIVLMRYIYYKMVNIRFYLKNAKITRPPFKLRFNSLLQDGLESMITAETEISCPMPTKLCSQTSTSPTTIWYSSRNRMYQEHYTKSLQAFRKPQKIFANIRAHDLLT